MNNDTYTNRLFTGSIDEIRELHSLGMSAKDISEKVNLSEYLVSALIERFVVEWDHYSGLPSPKAYEE